MIAEPLRPLARPIAGLRPLPGNPRRGDVKAVARSLKRFGQRKPVVVQADGTVEAGNHMLLAALELGWTELAAVGVDDDEPTAKAFALADNRTAELGGFDMGALAVMAAEVHGVDPGLLEAASYSEADLNALLAGQRVPPKLNDPDAVPEPPGEPVTRPRDVWLLGPHRLLCGDATDMAAVEAMLGGDRCDCMWTDPPYGVNYNDFATPEKARAARRRTDGLRVSNDQPADLPELLAGAFAVATAVLRSGAAVYIAHPPGALCKPFFDAFFQAGWKFHEGLVWVKDRMVLGHADYHYRHEPIMYGYTAGEGRRGRGGAGWYGDHSQTSVFDIPKPARSEQHPTMKPVELVARCLANSSPPLGLVYDPFAGSGSTVIAAHGTNRVTRAVEIDPAYCDVICRRYAEHTGTKPVLEANGEPHDFTA